MAVEIGIDFGTTNTVVCYRNLKGRWRYLKYRGTDKVVISGQADDIIPSVVYFYTRTDCVIGYEAKRRLSLYPRAGVDNFKPRIGDKEQREIAAENGDTFSVFYKQIAKIFLNKILKELDDVIARQLDSEVGGVVLTVPAKFNDKEKSSAKWAARNADFEDVKLATEPTAAAVAAVTSAGEELTDGSLLVYDFGGGTFDVSVIQKKGDKYIEIATGGDKNLGGNTITDRIAQKIFSLIEDEYGIELPYMEDDFDEEYHGIPRIDYLTNRKAIFDEADRIKEELSASAEYEAMIDLILPSGRRQWMQTWTRDYLEGMIRPDIERTVEITEKTVIEAKERGVPSIDRIVLAGGSSQIPLVQKLMTESFGEKSQFFKEDVSNLIARGAEILASKELNDVTEPITNIQYGIAVKDGELLKQFETIIPEDQSLPCTAKREFYLNTDGQTQLEISYFERDIKNYPNARRTDDDGITEIDTIVIDLPEGLRKNEVEIEVGFHLLRDGTLEIGVDVFKAGNKIYHTEASAEKMSNVE